MTDNTAQAATTPDPLTTAINEHLLRENQELRAQIDTLKGIQEGTQRTLDLMTKDLEKRGQQVAQAMLNLAEIAGASKQQTDAMNNLTAQLKRANDARQ